jgi:hypothetical protein
MARAMAAERHYDGLTRISATVLAREGVRRADIPRRMFEKFYASDSPAAAGAAAES